ncbi:MAG: radical SAM protein [Phascolarctobacterium sp.]|nr:radical SAM protein [Phascolarctobacterium sp.]
MSILPIFIPHAGCPHQCIFCNQKTISGQKTAAVAGAKAQIARWMQWLKPSLANEAAFYGGTFTALDLAVQEELLALTDELIAQHIIGSVRLSTRPDYIDQERLALLKAHHVQLVELGVQSLDDSVLALAGRGHDTECVYNAHALLREVGFKTGIQLMVGLPGQSFASVQDTAQHVALLAPDVARIYPVLVLKNTPLAQSYARGEYAPLTLEDAVTQSAYVYSTLRAAGVNVIRIGLQPDEELCAPGNILAGPFHPALGELVKSRVLREHFTPIIQQMVRRGAEGVIFHCPRAYESKLRGQKNCNLEYWAQEFPGLKLTIMPSSADAINLCVMGSACSL